MRRFTVGLAGFNMILSRVASMSAAFILVLFLQFTWASVIRADLIGATVDVAAYFPNSSTVFYDPGNRVVSDAIEYPAGSYPTYNTAWQVDVGANQLNLEWTDPSSGGVFAYGTFNGFIMTMVSGPQITSAVVDPSSGFRPNAISIENGNELLLNFQGVSYHGLTSSVIDITTETVPEPSTLALFIAGAAGVLAFARRRKRSA